MRKLTDKEKLKNYTPAAVMLLCSCIAFQAVGTYMPMTIRTEAKPERIEETESMPETEEETPFSEIVAAEETEADETAPYRLNLAYLVDENGESYAQILMRELIRKDSVWYSELYDMAGTAPSVLAARYGKPAGKVIGKYNPASSKQLENDPSTWTVEHFKNVKISFYNGDGSITAAVSNAQQIVSMANVYCYYNNIEDLDTIRSYVNELWKKSHSYGVSISDVYYCSGCIDPDNIPDNEETDSELEGEDYFNGVSTIDTEISVKVEGDDGEVILEETEYSDNSSEETGQESRDTSGISVQTTPEYSGTTVAVESTTSVIQSLAETAESIYMEETKPSVVIIRDTTAESTEDNKKRKPSIASEEKLPESTAAITEESSAQISETSESSASSVKEQIPEETGKGTIIVRPDQESKEADLEPEEEYRVRAAAVTETKAAESGTQPASTLICPGHIDLKVTAKILGLEGEKNLYGLDETEEAENENEQSEDENSWKGWDDRKKAYVSHIQRGDWAKAYGITVTVADSKAPLSSAEIDSYMSMLPSGTSEARKDIIRFALQSVGKIPYYWGGKANTKNYSGNNFGSVTIPDHRGRILKGLDCSGWVNWVYWSVTGKHLGYEGTEGLKALGRQVERKNLKPGDIVVITGNTPHVIMFLGWAENGQIRCIHETGSVNNVTVGVMNANWPYYRNLLD